VEAGDEVLIPNPGFVAYPTITAWRAGDPTFYQLPAARDFSFDLMISTADQLEDGRWLFAPAHRIQRDEL